MCCSIREIHGMTNAMMQCTQGTQLNCIALNCVVQDASFLGGRTDMRTPPQHTHQYIRHRHHSSRRNTAEGKILQYGASHSQSTICLCWKHFKAVKGIDWSAAQQCNKKQGTLFGGKLIFFNSSSFQYNVLQLQYCVVSHIRWFFCSFLHFYFYSYRQAYFLRWQIGVSCVLCFVFTTERLSTSWSWPSLKTFSSSGYWWHPRTGGGAHGVHLNMAACNWCDTTNTGRPPHCLHCLCWNTQVCKPASATWREVLVHNSAKPCSASATKYETTFADKYS